MAHSSRSRLVNSIALVLPLAVGGWVWWMAGFKEPVTVPAAGVPGEMAAERQVPLPPASHLKGSFGLPGAEVAKDDVFAKFESWATEYAAKGQPDTLAAGLQLAGQRREALRSLIQSDPRAALARALPWSLRNRMPAEVTSLLEQRVSALAEYSVKGARQAPEAGPKVEPVQRHAIIDGHIYKAYVYGRREWLGTKNDLPVEGIAVDESLAILENPIRELEAGEPQPAKGIKVAAQDEHIASPPPAAPPVLVSGGQGYQSCCAAHAKAMEQGLNDVENRLGPTMGYEVAESAWTEGAKRILVIRVDFSDVTGEPQNINPVRTLTPAFATNLVNGVTNTFMSEVSYGKTSVSLNSADVTPVLRMPRPASYYAVNDDPDQLRLDCLAAAEALNYNIANYDRQMVVFSWIGSSRISGSRFGWAGLGQINGPFTWYNGYFDEWVVPHELGHNLSLYHANLWQVGSNNPVDLDDGYSVPYGDPFDCMGNGFYAPVNLLNFNPWFLNRIDWLPDSAVREINAPGTYRVYRYDDPSVPLNRTLALKISKDGTRDYWLSYRRKFADISGGIADVSAGAYIIWGFNGNNESQLIDASTPGSNPIDASLNVGTSLRDEEAGIIIRTVAAGGSGNGEYLDIRVEQDNRIYALQNSYDVDESAGSVTITLVRSGEPNEISTVLVETENSSAVAPSDYTAVSTTVTWNGTDTTNKTVTIPIIANSIREPPEKFRVNLTRIAGLSSQVVGSPITVNIREPGMADTSFSHGEMYSAGGSVRRFVAEPSGRVAFGGAVEVVGATSVVGVGRLEADGALDTTFNRTAGVDPLPVLAMARQADGKFLVGGAFSQLRGQPRNGVGRLENDGGLDTSFNPGTGANGVVRALDVQADGRIVVGGAFTSFGGQPRLGLARLMPDGSLDPTFLATPLPSLEVMDVEAIVLQPDGKMIVGGLIRTAALNDLFAGGFSSGVLRLNEDGTLDQGFDIGAGAHLAGDTGTVQRVFTLALQADKKVLVGGAFTGFGGASAMRIVRLNADGSRDTAFQTSLSTGASAPVRSITIQGDGRILLGGEFTVLSGSPRTYAGRLLSSGAIDTNFDAELPLTNELGSPAICYQIQMLPDAKIFLATDALGTQHKTLRRIFSGQQSRAGVIEFASGSVEVNEGGAAQVEIRRTGGALGTVSVNYALIPGTADLDDYADMRGTLTWLNGDASSRFITVQASADSTAEEREFFNVQLGVPCGGVSLGERALSTVAVVDPGAADFPVVRFTSDSRSVEESMSGPITVTVELSEASTEIVRVPVTLGGTAFNIGAGTDGDYTLATPLPLVFSPGQTSKTLQITLRQDAFVEGDETASFRLGYPIGPALLGNPALYTLTITDDDVTPTILGAPAYRMVGAGQPAGPFEPNVTGTQPMALEWLLNGRRIVGASSASYGLPAASVKDGGTYVLKAKNRLSASERLVAELVVVDTSAHTLVMSLGSSVTMKADAGGSGIRYTWRKVGGTTRGTDTISKTHTISKLELSDSGTYICQVRTLLPAVPSFMDGATYILKVTNAAPEFLTLEDGDTLPPAIISGSYNYPIEVNAEVNKAPMSYSAAGLPAGMKVDAVTGIIGGKPTVRKATPYDVTLTAANKAGKAVVKVKLLVDIFPTHLAGDYVGIVGRQPNLNQSIGGRLDVKITTTGAYSGKLVHGGLTHSLKGVMDVMRADSAPPVALPSGRLRIVRTGKPAPRPLDLFFEIDPATRRITTATLGDGFDSVTFTGWKQTWDAKTNKADAFDGYHTFALEMPDAIPNVPRGYGHGAITVSPGGIATLVGKTGDGESIKASSFISESGEIAFFQTLYKTKPTGSMLGKLQLERGASETDDTDNRLSGFLSWQRPETTTKNARVYAAGFGPLEVRAFGGRYLPQSLVLGLPGPGKVSVTFSDAGPAASRNPNAEFDIGLKNKITLAGTNPAAPSLKTDAAKGAYSGKFALEDANPPPTVKRAVTYQGMVVPTENGLAGFGYFTLPQLPSALVSPPTTSATSPILSGKVLLSPVVTP